MPQPPAAASLVPLTALKKPSAKQEAPKTKQVEASQTINLSDILAARNKLRKRASTPTDKAENGSEVNGSNPSDFSNLLEATLKRISVASRGLDSSDQESENSDFE